MAGEKPNEVRATATALRQAAIRPTTREGKNGRMRSRPANCAGEPSGTSSTRRKDAGSLLVYAIIGLAIRTNDRSQLHPGRRHPERNCTTALADPGNLLVFTGPKGRTQPIDRPR